jgi:acyl-CoA thioesterase FadM
MARVRSDRNYEIRRVRDNRLIARAIANWVYLDAATLAPTRIPPEITSIFSPDEPPALPPIGKVELSQKPGDFEYKMRRQAQFYEADSAQHVNNAVYVDWIEEAVCRAVSAMGLELTVTVTPSLPWFARHSIEYVRAAVPPDEIEIHVRLVRRGITRGVWEIEMTRSATAETLLRAVTTSLWLDGANRPMRWA